MLMMDGKRVRRKLRLYARDRWFDNEVVEKVTSIMILMTTNLYVAIKCPKASRTVDTVKCPLYTSEKRLLFSLSCICHPTTRGS